MSTSYHSSSVEQAITRRSVLSVSAAAALGRWLSPVGSVTSGQVVRSKQRLNDQGYWCGPVNTKVDDLTTCAVLAYQKAHGYTVDGVLDHDVMLALTKPRPTPHFTTTGKVVEVDRERQLLRVVDYGKVILVVHTSTGDNGKSEFGDRQVVNRTPTGKFRIRKGEDGVVTTSLGTQYRPRYFLGRYGIYGQSHLAEIRGPSTTGGVAVHVRALDLLVGKGHLARGRRVLIA